MTNEEIALGFVAVLVLLMVWRLSKMPTHLVRCPCGVACQCGRRCPICGRTSSCAGCAERYTPMTAAEPGESVRTDYLGVLPTRNAQWARQFHIGNTTLTEGPNGPGYVSAGPNEPFDRDDNVIRQIQATTIAPGGPTGGSAQRFTSDRDGLDNRVDVEWKNDPRDETGYLYTGDIAAPIYSTDAMRKLLPYEQT